MDSIGQKPYLRYFRKPVRIVCAKIGQEPPKKIIPLDLFLTVKGVHAISNHHSPNSIYISKVAHQLILYKNFHWNNVYNNS